MKSPLRWIFFPFLLLYFVIIVIPIARILTFQPISALENDISSGVLQSIILTYEICGIVAISAVMFSLPYSFVMARGKTNAYKAADSLVELPIMVPHTVVGVMMLITFEPGMPIGRFLGSIFPGYSFDDTIFAVFITLFFLSSAYSIREIGTSYRKEIMDYEDVAKTLGIGEFTSFAIVSVRMLLRPILKGFLLTWARSVSEVGAILIVAYYVFPSFNKLAGVFIYSQWISEGLGPAAASSAILVLTGILITAIFKIVENYHVKSVQY
ncbi:MAG: ABC transporter permease subunit [Thermoplasmata archaeon]